MDLKGNLSTEHQLPGDAKRPESATLDKNRPPEDERSDRGERPFIAANREVRGSAPGAGGDSNRGPSSQDEEKRQNHEAVHNGGRLSEAGAHDGLENEVRQAVDNQSTVSPDDYPDRNTMRNADKG